MRQASIKIVSAPPRLMTKAEAAEYSARSVKRFEVECTVTPIKFPNGDLRWDVHDVDAWIDSMKSGFASECADDIVARLR
jgi:hypothetical protein